MITFIYFFRWNVFSLFEINFESMTISYSTNESVIIQKSNKIKSYEEEKLDKPEYLYMLIGKDN